MPSSAYERPTRFGRQPARVVLAESQLLISVAAEKIGVKRAHLMHAVHGVVRPSEAVRRELPKLVGRPIEELFTAEALQPFGRTVYAKDLVSGSVKR